LGTDNLSINFHFPPLHGQLPNERTLHNHPQKVERQQENINKEQASQNMDWKHYVV